MIPKTLICLLLGTGLLLVPQAVQISLAQTDTTEPQNSLRCDRCSVTYPEEAHLFGAEGIVELMIDIDADGRVTNVLVMRSSGSVLLDRNALETVRTWQFQPMPEGAEGIFVEVEYRAEGRESRESQQLTPDGSL
ncbi:MAG: energy transducer TonB [Leptolyngbyaceae cyanobacterium SL_5_9]|nr:energy transducer TonB [Leptolyngbyaceae cyanobacterium SL_5_9]NJO72781.1 energy transducer TonB [Leptolyngbyaceae cyanobacterium RM1_406_9]